MINSLFYLSDMFIFSMSLKKAMKNMMKLISLHGFIIISDGSECRKYNNTMCSILGFVNN